MSWEETPAPENRTSSTPARLGTALFTIMTLIVLLCYISIFVNPQFPWNPFPPFVVRLPSATAAAQIQGTPTVVPTFTPPQPFPATWTPTPTPTVTWTFTPRPTATWTLTPRPTATLKPLPPFSTSSPIYTQQTIYANTQDWWTGIAGEVADRKGQPVTNVVVRVWDDSGHVWERTPGDSPKYADVYGTKYGSKGTFAWWEQFLESSCQKAFWVHLQIYRDGKPASGVLDLKTSGECSKNLIIVHWVKNY